ncbi:hypothetical protein D9613_009398 [Agrocybe pediades]|uniref:Cytochrome P450 n=1 Tax=Agrocybe pediades TaxID=84607 RepID=A0A8H4R359_9AGAR|nr:hypothetical protein D9613_009398 [Agrocybe pediades]
MSMMWHSPPGLPTNFQGVAIAVLLCLLLLKWTSSIRNKRSSLPLPPSPKGSLPILGNLFSMPTKLEWKQYHQWCKEFGTDILYLNVAGTSMIVLDTEEAASDLLEKRSSKYSGRFRMPMVLEVMKWNFIVGFMDYGQQWRGNRRIIHNIFHPNAAARLKPQMLRSTRHLLNRFLDHPSNVVGNFRHMSGETILSITYGIQVKEYNDPYVKTIQEGMDILGVASIPGTYLVDTFPILKYVPEWLPGASFKRKAREWKDLGRRVVEEPYEAAKRLIASGDHSHNFVAFSLDRIQSEDDAERKQKEEDVKASAGTMYAAGSDTTTSTLSSCVLGLLLRPELIKRAQRDIDSVTKGMRLPEFDDESQLPFITALVKESLRWEEVLPIAIPHHNSTEDEYKGYRIPAGSIIIPNAWAMLHDERVYPDPFSFKPERFLKADGTLDTSVKDPSHACFGFGRRICPGRYMAYSAVWIAVASLLSVFDIEKAVDGNGNIIEPKYEYISSLVRLPEPFTCSIKPRSKAAEKLIRSANMT